jgi:hypothetical protein
MKRRGFIRLALALALASQFRVAQGGTNVSSKGIVCSNISPEQLNPLNLDWYRTSWGVWCWEWIPNMPQGWVFNLSYNIPPISDVTAALANPYHGNWWMVGGNEAATETNPATGQLWTAQQIANLVIAQISAVTAAQPTAKFCLAGGTQTHAPGNRWNNPVWIDAVWALLPQTCKDKIKAIDFHWYAQVEYGENDERIFNKAPVKRGINDWKDWRTSKGLDVQLWLSEIGLAWNDLVTPENPQVTNYPGVVQAACNETGIDRWSWFMLEGNPDYACPYYGPMTPLGEVFGSI